MNGAWSIAYRPLQNCASSAITRFEV
jgi:hypothetical protein